MMAMLVFFFCSEEATAEQMGGWFVSGSAEIGCLVGKRFFGKMYLGQVC